MKFYKFISLVLFLCLLPTAVACSRMEKKITVVVREVGSGTREAFDTMVTDGAHFLAESDKHGRTRHNTTDAAIVQTKNGALLSSVASDINAIGYLSLASVNESVRPISINGVFPKEETIFDGTYPLQRPYVIMTSSRIDPTPRTADFLRYLKSDAVKPHVASAGCFFPPENGIQNEGKEEFLPLSLFPTGEKIVIRGSTSLEKLILSAAKDYAARYGVNASEIFDVQLEGSSVGRKAAENDTQGNIIGLSSVAVESESIEDFLLCVDAIAVIVHPENPLVNDLSLTQLYDVFCGKIQSFSGLAEETGES